MVLIVSAHTEWAEILSDCLQAASFKVAIGKSLAAVSPAVDYHDIAGVVTRADLPNRGLANLLTDLRAQPATVLTPVAIIGHPEDPEDLRLARELGVEVELPETATPEDIKEVMSTIVKNGQADQMVVGGTGSSPVSKSSAGTSETKSPNRQLIHNVRGALSVAMLSVDALAEEGNAHTRQSIAREIQQSIQKADRLLDEVRDRIIRLEKQSESAAGTS